MKKLLLSLMFTTVITTSFAYEFSNNVGGVPFVSQSFMANQEIPPTSEQQNAVSKASETLSNTITTSLTGSILRLTTINNLTQSNIDEFLKTILENIDKPEKDRKLISVLVGEEAKKHGFNTTSSGYKNLAGAAFSYYYAITAADESLAAKEDTYKYIARLVGFHTGVCDNFAVYTFALLSQNTAFKNSIMIPGIIRDKEGANNDHTILLVRLNKSDISGNSDYVIDNWMPMTYIDYGTLSDSKKALFLPVKTYLENLKKKSYPYHNSVAEKTANFADQLANIWKDNLTKSSNDKTTYKWYWEKDINVEKPDQLTYIAKVLSQS